MVHAVAEAVVGRKIYEVAPLHASKADLGTANSTRLVTRQQGTPGTTCRRSEDGHAEVPSGYRDDDGRESPRTCDEELQGIHGKWRPRQL